MSYSPDPILTIDNWMVLVVYSISIGVLILPMPLEVFLEVA